MIIKFVCFVEKLSFDSYFFQKFMIRITPNAEHSPFLQSIYCDFFMRKKRGFFMEKKLRKTIPVFWYNLLLYQSIANDRVQKFKNLHWKKKSNFLYRLIDLVIENDWLGINGVYLARLYWHTVQVSLVIRGRNIPSFWTPKKTIFD